MDRGLRDSPRKIPYAVYAASLPAALYAGSWGPVGALASLSASALLLGAWMRRNSYERTPRPPEPALIDVAGVAAPAPLRAAERPDPHPPLVLLVDPEFHKRLALVETMAMALTLAAALAGDLSVDGPSEHLLYCAGTHLVLVMLAGSVALAAEKRQQRRERLAQL